MNIWSILNILPTNDPKLIRKAYAEQLKKMHPEEDPEGFANLRAAYEQALQADEKPLHAPLPFAPKEEKEETPTAVGTAYQMVDELMESEEDLALFETWVKEGTFANLDLSLAFQEQLLADPFAFSKPLFLAAYREFQWSKRRLSLEGMQNHFALLDQSETDPSFTPLMQAVLLENLEKAQASLKDLYQQNEAGDTALHLACRIRSTQMVKFLLDADAHLEVTNQDGQTPLSIAVEEDDLEITELLTAAGANLKHVDKKNRSLLQIAVSVASVLLLIFLASRSKIGGEISALRYSILSNSLQKVKVLVEHGVDLTLTPEDQDTPLICAIRNDRPEIVAYLLESGANPNQSQKDYFPLEFAAMRGAYESIESLLKAGAKVTHRALHYTVEHSHFDCTALILHSLNPKNKDELEMITCYGASAGTYGCASLLDDAWIHFGFQNLPAFVPVLLPTLLLASYEGDLEEIESELEQGVDVNQRDSSFDRTALYCASEQGHLKCASYLLEKGANPNLFAHQGLSPLHVAIQNHHNDIVRLLLSHQADFNLAASSLQYSPLFMATKYQNREAFDLLIEKGAKDPPTCCFHSALAAAVYNNDVEMAEALVKHGANIKQVFRSPAYTLLYLAARCGHNDVLKYLLTLPLHPDWHPRPVLGQMQFLPTFIPQTPLAAAVKNGNIESVSLLLEAGANPNLTPNGYPPIHFAQAHCETANYAKRSTSYFQIIDLLLENGADIDAKSDNGDTFLLHAIKNRAENIAAYLIDKGADFTLPDRDGHLPATLAESYDLPNLAKLIENHTIKQ